MEEMIENWWLKIITILMLQEMTYQFKNAKMPSMWITMPETFSFFFLRKWFEWLVIKSAMILRFQPKKKKTTLLAFQNSIKNVHYQRSQF